MTTPLLPHQLDEFVNLTLERFDRKKWVDLSLPLQRYIFASQMFKDKQVRYKGGSQLNWKVQVSNTGSFQDSELYGIDQIQVKELTAQAKAPWTKSTVNFTYDVDEDEFQSGPETIIRELKVREHSMYNDFFEGMEERMWTSPTSSTQNPAKPYGIPFWIQKSSTAAFGFNGGDPSGFSLGAGELATGTYANWKNGTFTYKQVSDDDMLAKLNEACEKCNFMAPHSFDELGNGASDWGFYTVFSVLDKCQRLLKSSNDNIGTDLGKYRNQTLFKSNPIIWVPALTNSTHAAYDSANPIYGVNWNSFEWYFKSGRDMVRHKPVQRHPQHTVRTVFMDTWGNYRCTNRRNQFVGQEAS